jgi:hypothetical protein
MNSLQLGDYKGSRDTLQTAMSTAYSPLENVQAAARAFGQQGMANAGAQRLERMKENFMQQATLDAAMTAEKVATTAYGRSVETATALGEANNKVMETKNAGALAAQKAAAEAAKGVVTDAEKTRLKILGAKNKGQILAHKTAFKAVLDSLGQDHPYYKHLQNTLALLDQLEQDEDHDRVFGGLSGINSNPAEVVKQAEQLIAAQKEAEKRALANKKPPEPTKLFNFKNRPPAPTTPTPAATGNLFNVTRRQ